MRGFTLGRRTLLSLAVAGLVSAGIAGFAWASDHQQSRLTELQPRTDITDIYAFPGSGGTDASRTTLVMDTSSPLLPADTPGAQFDPNLLYQFKIDNTGDGIEDLVIQVTFDSTSQNNRVINVRGPAAPPARMDPIGQPVSQGGTATVLLRNAPVSLIGGATGTVINVANAAGPISVFAGPRDDPFFVDLEQFFRIIPDRKPVTGPLAALPETPTASAFRGAAAPFDVSKGAPVDLLTVIKANTLSIVLEMPTSLLAPGTNKKIGVWGTISR